MKMTNTKKKPWLWISLACCALVIITVAIFSAVTQRSPIRSAVAVKGTIQSYVEERARTSLPHIYHITMPLQGNILPIIVEEGDTVTPGQLVAQVDDIDWRDNVLQVDNIVVAVEKWVESIESQVKASKIREEYTKWEWETNKELLRSDYISERTGRNSKRWYLDSAVKIEEGQAMFHMSKAFQEITDILPAYVKRNLEKTQIKSPVAGKVLKRHVWNEKVMNPGEPLLDIGDMDELEITADILTEQVVRVQPGDRVEIFGEALGETRLEGIVRRIEPEAFTKISSLGVEEQRVAVKISFGGKSIEDLKESGRTLGLGYRVRIRIFTDEKSEATIVPRTVLFHGIKGNWQLYRVLDGKTRLTDVEVGLLNNYDAEILSGIQVNDIVVIAPESSISEGSRVEVMKHYLTP